MLETELVRDLHWAESGMRLECECTDCVKQRRSDHRALFVLTVAAPAIFALVFLAVS